MAKRPQGRARPKHAKSILAVAFLAAFLFVIAALILRTLGPSIILH